MNPWKVTPVQADAGSLEVTSEGPWFWRKEQSYEELQGTEVLQRRELFASFCWGLGRRNRACLGPIYPLFVRLVGLLLVMMQIHSKFGINIILLSLYALP